jgi:hypothetical protein
MQEETGVQVMDVSRETSVPLVLAGDPVKQIGFAKKAATALIEVVRAGNLAVKLGQSEHLKFEAWQTIGRFYGATVVVEWSRRLTDEAGEVIGYEARANVLGSNGQIIGAAEAMCTRDEERWGERPKYEWRDGKRVQTGSIPVAEFEVRSMAQTRACAKALRNVFAWVVVMAGYAPTPNEELDNVRKTYAHQQSRPASEKQIGFIKGLVRELGKTDEWFEQEVFKKSYASLTSTQASSYIKAFQERLANKTADNGDGDYASDLAQDEPEPNPDDIPF